MANFAYQPITKPDVVESQKGNNNAIEKFLNDLRKTTLSESTINGYRGYISYVMSGIYVPIMSITSSLITERIAECYREGKWADSTIPKVIGVMHRFFMWCKNNMYTSLTISITNPITGKIPAYHDNTSSTKQSQVTSKIVVTTPITSKVNKTPAPIINTEPTNVNFKAIALLAIMRRTNLKEQEIAELNIMDFMYDRLVYQGHGNKSFMRIVPIDVTTRNAIYDYLKTRNDNIEALFLSDKSMCERITAAEIRATNVT